MRQYIVSLLVIVGVVLAITLTCPVWAFHDVGAAHCDGCHTMHNSRDGMLVDPDSPNGNPWLLIKASPSDVCINCHDTSLGEVFSDDVLSPGTEYGGGNFVFLLTDNINDAYAGANSPILGNAAGHNIISHNKGISADPVLTVSPGGNFPSEILACSSCHNPHGTDTFRFLYGTDRLVQEFYTFTNPAPDAKGLPIFGDGESNSNHTAYQSGMSGWCGNCHGDFHSKAGGRMVHPSGSAMGGIVAQIYNLYNGAIDQIGGIQSTAYLAEVPFEDPSMEINTTAGPTASSKVMCLSCHRAHASSAPDAGRWDFSVTRLRDDGEESGSYAIPDPYVSNEQGSLCNKCHRKDEFDSITSP